MCLLSSVLPSFLSFGLSFGGLPSLLLLLQKKKNVHSLCSCTGTVEVLLTAHHLDRGAARELLGVVSAVPRTVVLLLFAALRGCGGVVHSSSSFLRCDKGLWGCCGGVVAAVVWMPVWMQLRERERKRACARERERERESERERVVTPLLPSTQGGWPAQ